jgi:UPF0271 protein
VLADAAAVLAQARSIVLEGSVRSIDGASVAVSARSLCLHGDTPGAADLARQVRATLTEAGVDIRAFS